jgi:dihydrofolate reductase
MRRTIQGRICAGTRPRLASGAAKRASAVAMAGDEAFVIGGAEVFGLFEPLADRWELTEVHEDALGDTTMPAPDRAKWDETARDGHDGYSFVTLARR